MSCCEEQEAKEAAEYAKYRAAVRASEARILARKKFFEDASFAIRCGDGCDCCDCAECDEEEGAPDGEQGKAPEPTASGQTSAESSDGFESDEIDEDMAEIALIEKMRRARMAEMRGDAAAAAQRRRDGHGAYLSVGEAALTALLRDSDAPPVVCHIALADDDVSEVVHDTLGTAAPKFADARIVRYDASAGAPSCLAHAARHLPAVLVIDRGVVAASCDDIHGLREPAAIREAVDGWVSAQLDFVMRERKREMASGSDDEDDECLGYCGRRGCRSYPHEHVAWGERPQG